MELKAVAQKALRRYLLEIQIDAKYDWTVKKKYADEFITYIENNREITIEWLKENRSIWIDVFQKYHSHLKDELSHTPSFDPDFIDIQEEKRFANRLLCELNL